MIEKDLSRDHLMAKNLSNQDQNHKIENLSIINDLSR